MSEERLELSYSARPMTCRVLISTDRLGRPMADVVTIATELHERGIKFRLLTERFDTTTAGGELFFHICAAFAQMNGRIISERTVSLQGRTMSPAP